MRALFAPRGWILIWAFFMAIVGLSAPLNTLAQQMRASNLDKDTAQFLASLNSIPPTIINAIFENVHVPPQIKFPGGSLSLETNMVFILIGAVFIAIGLFLHRRAVRSDAFFDDFLALLFLYLFLQIGTGLWMQVKFMPQPIQSGFLAILLTTLITFFTLRGGGVEDSKIFFRGVLQIFIVWLIFYPTQTIGLMLGGIERLAGLGADLKLPAAFGIWSAIGLILALPLIYNIGQKSRAASPAPSAKPAPAADKKNGGPLGFLKRG